MNDIIKYGLYFLAIIGLVRCQTSEPVTEPSAEPSAGPTSGSSEGDSSAIEAGILLILALLVVSFYTGYILHRFHVEYLFESGGAILWGIIIGAIIRFATTEGVNTLRSVVSFNSEVFLLGLLPPIIIESGYNLKRRSFFYNLDGILFFAFLGTAISALSYAGLVYLVIYLGWTQHTLTLSDCFLFGALISATDPVTVLSIFKMLGVNPHLYANVFGESVLNDAVAIVLYKTIANVGDAEFTAERFFIAFGEFVKIFFGSLGIGAGVALLMALMYKYSTLYKFPVAETSLFVLLSIASYILSEYLALSGIVAALFCGMLLDYYAFNNLSETSQRATKRIFLVLGSIAETFIFNYIGLALFAFNQEYDYALILLCIPILFISRALNVFPLSGIINSWREKNHRVTGKDQFMLWFSGLRGAIALALALSVKNPIDEPVIFTTTLMLILFTVIILGGTTIPIMKCLNIEAKALKHNPNPNIDVTEDEYNFTIENKFLRVDRKYLWPFFTRGTAHSHLPMDEKAADAAREVEDLMDPDQNGANDAEVTIEMDGRSNGASPSDSNTRASTSLHSSTRARLSGSRNRGENIGSPAVGKETVTSSQEIRSPYPVGIIHRSSKAKISKSEVPPHREWDLGNEDEKQEELDLWRTAEIKFKDSTGTSIRRIDFHEPNSEHQIPEYALHVAEHALHDGAGALHIEMQPVVGVPEPDDSLSSVNNNINSNNTMVTVSTQEVLSSPHVPNLNQNQEVLPPSSDFESAVQQQLANNAAAVEHQDESSEQSSVVSTEESSTSKSSSGDGTVIEDLKHDTNQVVDPDDVSSKSESREDKSSSEST